VSPAQRFFVDPNPKIMKPEGFSALGFFAFYPDAV
jgi:hypothetical protein